MSTALVSSSIQRPQNIASGSGSSLRISKTTSTSTDQVGVSASSFEVPSEPVMDELRWETEEDSIEVEVPDFHFDWGVTKDKTRPAENCSISQSVERLSLSRDLRKKREHGLQSSMLHSLTATPPGNPATSLHSSTSSMKSASNTSSDVSPCTAILSSVSPGPSGLSADILVRPTSADLTTGSGTASNRMYGGGRTFQRVVSAPLTSNRYRGTEEVDSRTVNSSSIHTTTIRPSLPHHNSSTSVYPSAGSSTRNLYTTPGLTDRVLGVTSASTARRLGGLSRFGGPARRVAPPSESEELEEPGFCRESPPLQDAYYESSPTEPNQHISPSLIVPDSYISQQDPVPRASPTNAHVPKTKHTLGSRSDQFASGRALQSKPGDDGLFSKVASNAKTVQQRRFHMDQENAPEGEIQTLLTSNDPRAVTKDNDNDRSTIPRDLQPPLHPSHSVVTKQTPPPDHRGVQHGASKLQAARSAPIIEIVNSEHRDREYHESHALAHHTAPAPPTVIPQVMQAGKRSYVVNGSPYERVGVLGKGGSSKVYSVICPAKRVIYALKRVALDRADSETYQSYTNEIELLKRLRGHDRIIQLIDYQITFSQSNRPKVLMMVMECGEIDFAMLLDEQRGKPLNMNFVGLYWEQMLEAVQAVHQENVVHTDLKPANFVLVKGRLKIIDFGIAKAIANDTVNIQRDQQIGTVNYMSPEAIQRMNNQKVLKLSYPSDVWSLGCILYQMIYGSGPFAHIPGGPLPKMNAIADPRHTISYPEEAVPRPSQNAQQESVDPLSLAVRVSPAAIDSMRKCLAYKKEERLSIPALLCHEFLRPRMDSNSPTLPSPNSTTITPDQMALLVNFVLRQNGLDPLPKSDTTATDLYHQLETQNNTFDNQ